MPAIPNELRARITTVRTEHAHSVRAVRDARRDRAAARADRDAAEIAQSATQTVAAALQTNAHQQIAQVVTRCLQASGWDYEFWIEFLRKRGKTEARLGFYRNGVRVDPVGAAGGGPVDMAALALRLAALALAVPRRRPVLILDEPFRGVNGTEHRRRAAELIGILARELGVQFIVATGHEWLRIGKVVEL